jgi:hypothetical protein
MSLRARKLSIQMIPPASGTSSQRTCRPYGPHKYTKHKLQTLEDPAIRSACIIAESSRQSLHLFHRWEARPFWIPSRKRCSYCTSSSGRTTDLFQKAKEESKTRPLKYLPSSMSTYRCSMPARARVSHLPGTVPLCFYLQSLLHILRTRSFITIPCQNLGT